MKISKSLYDALMIIKSECEGHGYCYNCPMYCEDKDESNCMSEERPFHWNLHELEVEK